MQRLRQPLSSPGRRSSSQAGPGLPIMQLDFADMYLKILDKGYSMHLERRLVITG